MYTSALITLDFLTDLCWNSKPLNMSLSSVLVCLLSKWAKGKACIYDTKPMSHVLMTSPVWIDTLWSIKTVNEYLFLKIQYSDSRNQSTCGGNISIIWLVQKQLVNELVNETWCCLISWITPFRNYMWSASEMKESGNKGSNKRHSLP